MDAGEDVDTLLSAPANAPVPVAVESVWPEDAVISDVIDVLSKELCRLAWLRPDSKRVAVLVPELQMLGAPAMSSMLPPTSVNFTGPHTVHHTNYDIVRTVR